MTVDQGLARIASIKAEIAYLEVERQEAEAVAALAQTNANHFARLADIEEDVA